MWNINEKTFLLKSFWKMRIMIYIFYSNESFCDFLWIFDFWNFSRFYIQAYTLMSILIYWFYKANAIYQSFEIINNSSWHICDIDNFCKRSFWKKLRIIRKICWWCKRFKFWINKNFSQRDKSSFCDSDDKKINLSLMIVLKFKKFSLIS